MTGWGGWAGVQSHGRGKGDGESGKQGERQFNNAPHLPPPERQLERKRELRILADPPNEKCGLTLGAGAWFVA